VQIKRSHKGDEREIITNDGKQEVVMKAKKMEKSKWLRPKQRLFGGCWYPLSAICIEFCNGESERG
jgi:hypothetical protein